jgi:hypothetical protein
MIQSTKAVRTRLDGMGDLEGMQAALCRPPQHGGDVHTKKVGVVARNTPRNYRWCYGVTGADRPPASVLNGGSTQVGLEWLIVGITFDGANVARCRLPHALERPALGHPVQMAHCALWDFENQHEIPLG